MTCRSQPILNSFPAAQVMPYTATADMGVLRTSMEGGNARQRRRYYTMPHTFALEFIMDVPTLGNWQAWINANAYDFFEMPLLEFNVEHRRPGGFAPLDSLHVKSHNFQRHVRIRARASIG